MFKDKSEKSNNNLRILFIGNSHTYFNDMPNMVKRRALEEGFDCETTMLAHGGWFLSQHAEEPETRYNILFETMITLFFRNIRIRSDRKKSILKRSGN